MTDEEIQALQVELESTKAELEGVRTEKGTLASELETRGAAITELEQVVADRDSEVTALKQAVAKSDEVLTDVRDSLAQAVSSYRALVVQANPDVLDELISGDSVEAINQSVEHAQHFIFKVKQGLEEEAARTRVPVGAPQRTLPDLSALSPGEKIRYAIRCKR